MNNLEEAILTSLPKQIKHLSRDENGELWATKERPLVKKDSQGEFLVFGGSSGVVDMDLSSVYSLAVFNHLFLELPKLAIVELVR